MVRVYFGTKEKAIYNTSVFFKHRYQDSWFKDDFTRTIVADIDKSEVIDANSIVSPVLGNISPLQLSGGVKTLLLMKYCPGKIFNASNCGDNCAKWILKLGEERDFTINLLHIMDFGTSTFNIKIMNSKKKLIVHNMEEFLKAGATYLQGDNK